MSNTKPSEWDVSPAEFDFRSDTFTTPTPFQLAALQNASLGDDVYQESTTTTAFEARLAGLLGKPAAIFLLSGTMGNQLSLRAQLSAPPYSVLADHRAHIITSEAGGVAMLSGAQIHGVTPTNGKYLTLDDVIEHAELSDDVHVAPTRVVALENTLAGTIMPLEEAQKIGAWAKKHGMKVHLDGARIFNCVSAQAGDVDSQIAMLKAYCAAVDTVSVCFSKSLGAPVGSIVAGDEVTVKRIRHLRKSIGGGIRQAGILTAMANAALDEVFYSGRLTGTNAKAAKIAQYWTEKCGGKLTQPTESNMVWLDLKARGARESELVEECTKAGVKALGWGRFVLHWQNSDEAVDRVCRALESLAKKADERIAAGENMGKDDKKFGYGR